MTDLFYSPQPQKENPDFFNSGFRLMIDIESRITHLLKNRNTASKGDALSYCPSAGTTANAMA